MSSSVSFVLDNQIKTIDFERDNHFTPTTTLLQYLRSLPNHKGTKEGCAEGDCGACTVVLAEPNSEGILSYKAVDSCLIFLPMIHGKQVITIENLKAPEGKLHPVQKALVEANGSQCGFCTPGIVMSLFALYKNEKTTTIDNIKEALAGNLCRCTGYQPIIDAALYSCTQTDNDHFSNWETRVNNLLSNIKLSYFSYHNKNQKYFRPVSVNEALRLKKKYPNAYLLNGATDLALRVTKNHETLNEVIDLSAIFGLRGIRNTKGKTSIGAGTTLQEIKVYAKNRFPALFEMLSVFGSLQIRNLATLGGSLGSASPIGDSAPLLIAYNAQLSLKSLSGTRAINMNDFIRGYRKTNCHIDEIITAVEIPTQRSESQVHFYKISKRKDVDIASVSGGFQIILGADKKVEDIILAFGGMAEMTLRAKDVEKFLIGQIWDRDTIEKCLPLVDQAFKPISDARATARGRRLLARNLILKFWQDTT